MSSILIAVLSWLFCIGLLVFCVYLVSRYPLWFEKNSLRFLVASLVLGLGIYFFGYYFRDSVLFGGSQPQEFSLAELISSAALSFVSMSRMLVLELDLGELGIMGEISLFRMIYGLVLLLAVYSLAVAVLSLLGGKILSRIRIQFFYRFGSRHRIYMIYGFQPAMKYFVQDIRKSHPGSMILIFFQKELEEENPNLLKEMMSLGCVRGSTEEQPQALKDFAIPKRGIKDQIFFFSAFLETEKNLETITSLCDCLRKEKRGNLPIHIYGLVSYETCGEAALDQNFDGFSVHWTDVHWLSVRQVLSVHPLTDSIPAEFFEDGCLHQKIEIAVLGFSPEALCLYRSLLEEIQFKGVSFRLVLVGEGISEKTAAFRYMNPGIYEVSQIECADVSLGGPEFFEWLRERAEGICRFYCMDDREEVNVRLQKILGTACLTGENPEVYVFTRSHPPLWAGKEAVYFGMYEEIFTEEMMIHEKLDRMAAAVHMYYQIYYGASEEQARESWHSAKIFEKESSRSLALHLPSKLYSMGYRMEEGGDTSGFSQYLKQHETLVKNLAFGEHLRWETFFFARGWTAFGAELPDGKNKDLERKRHACLVPWEELKKVGEKYQVDYQYLDEHFIRNMDKIVSLAGYGLARIQNDSPGGKKNAGEKTV